MRAATRDGLALSLGSAVSGLLAYVFFAITTRTLGPTESSPIAVLWTYWSFSAATITFPVQHWVARSVAAHGHESEVRASLPRLVAVATGLALLVTLLAWLAGDSLFHRDDAWFPALTGLVTLGSAWIGLVRGGLTARRRFVHVGWALVGENGIRCVGAGLLVVTGSHSATAFGIALAAGPLIGLLWPGSVRFRHTDAARSAGSPLAFLAGAGGGQLASQFALTGAPLLLALAGGAAAEVTAVFVALALFRAPYTVALGVVAQLTGRLTGWVVERRADLLAKVRVGTGTTAVVAAVVTGAGAAWIGLPVIRLVFGPEITLDRAPVLMLAAGSTLALGNLVMTVLLMAQGRSTTVAVVWAVALVLGAVVFAALPGTEVDRICLAFLVAEAGALLGAFVGSSGRGSDGHRDTSD